MATKRGKSQARRTAGNRGGMPGWAWLVLGIGLALAVVLIAPKLMKTGGGDGFFRPKPNPDATPASNSDGEEDGLAAGDGNALPTPASRTGARPTRYDFYKMLPGNEVQMSDAEIAAIAREEAARKPAVAQPPSSAPDAASTAAAATGAPAAPPAAAAPRVTTADAPYLLQAGAFGAPADAEATKARVALLGLSARVEAAQINGRTVYRVRMGPYATAAGLAEAKRKLANGGLPAMALKAR